jgi:hypothetical protein
MTQQPAECQAAIDAVKELLDAHFQEAEDSADEDGKFSLGFRVTFDRSHTPTKLKVTCRVSKITTDEPSGARWPAIGCPEGDAGTRRQIECAIDDPNQAKLPL